VVAVKIYYIVASNGDGSSRVEFYDSKECIDYLCDYETGNEDYWDGDGGSWGTIEITGEVVSKGVVQTYDEMIAERCE
jgi:hypothetical protein